MHVAQCRTQGGVTPESPRKEESQTPKKTTHGVLRVITQGAKGRWLGGPPRPFDHGTSLLDMGEEETTWWDREVLRLQQIINSISDGCVARDAWSDQYQLYLCF